MQKKATVDLLASNKIESQLLEAVSRYDSTNKVLTNNTELPDLGVDSTGNLMVDISATVSDSLLTKIVSLGGRIIYPSKEYRTIRAIINLAVVQTIAARQDVRFVQPAVPAQNNAAPMHP